ncbi:MAG: S8 family serine peptidase [Calditrichaeota bacterium]|nr:S8 family serine peptidase [Calditrichota bacterium]
MAGASYAAPEAVPGQALVRFADPTTLERARAQFDAAEFRVEKVLVDKLDIYLVTFDEKLPVEQAVEQLRGYPQLKWAQADHKLEQRLTPNDPLFSTQWDMSQATDRDIDAPEAWDITTGGTDALGNDIVVAVVDGGCQLTHTDLAANIWQNLAEVNGVNGVDDDGNGYVDDKNGWDAYANDGTIPSDGHGTHVSGTVGAVGNNGSMVTGVNWNVKIMEVAASSGTTSIISIGYGYVLNQKTLWLSSGGTSGANVVSTNSSFGVDLADCESGTYPVWNDLYTAMGEVGILSAAATANANYNVDVQGDVPTSCSSPYLITVTNTTSTDAKNSGAGYGLTTIDLGAPGTSIPSTYPTNTTSSLTGTSMATPHVAGAVALMHAAASVGFANYYMQFPDSAALALKQMLLDGTDPITALQGITVSGGRLNLFNACTAINQFVGLSPNDPFLNLVSAASNDTVLGNANGTWERGESVEIIVELTNIGEDALNVAGTLSSVSPYVTINDASGTFGNIANGAFGNNALNTFSATLSTETPLDSQIEFTLSLTADSGYTREIVFSLDASPKVRYYFEDCESGAPEWTHSEVSGITDQWHLSTERVNSPTHAWKCGDTGTGTYASSQDAGLISPPIEISAESELRFWQDLDAELSGFYPDSAYDGALVEISVNGGAYTQIAPVGNYPKTYRTVSGNGNPFTGPLPGVPCYSGTLPGVEAVFDLAAYANDIVRFRFRFSSDASSGREGWYIDDISLYGAPASSVTPEPADSLVILSEGSDVILHWTASATPGVLYSVYMSTDPLIAPSDNTLVGQTADTTFTHVGILDLQEFVTYEVVATLP